MPKYTKRETIKEKLHFSPLESWCKKIKEMKEKVKKKNNNTKYEYKTNKYFFVLYFGFWSVLR